MKPIPFNKSSPAKAVLLTLATIGLMVALAACAWAAGGEGGAGAHESPWLGFGKKALNFAVLIAVLVYFLRSPLARFLRAAAAETREVFLGSRREADETVAALEAQQRRIEGLEGELKRMLEAARTDANTERVHLLAEAEAQAERIKVQARQQVEQEMRKARSELRQQLAEETVRLAEERIRGGMDETRQGELVDEFIGQLEESRP